MSTWPVWFTLIQSVLMAFVGMFLWSIRLSFKGGIRIADFDNHGRRLMDLEKRIDHGTTKISNLVVDVQNRVNDIREDCVTKREMDMAIAEFRRDRDHLNQQVHLLWSNMQPGRKS